MCGFQFYGNVLKSVVDTGQITGWVSTQFDVMGNLSGNTEMIFLRERTVVGRECESGIFSEYGTAVLDRLFTGI